MAFREIIYINLTEIPDFARVNHGSSPSKIGKNAILLKYGNHKNRHLCIRFCVFHVSYFSSKHDEIKQFLSLDIFRNILTVV